MSTAEQYLFTIIVVDYEDAVDRDDFRRAIRYLYEQTFQNFEILLIHDGPKKVRHRDELKPDHFNRINRIIYTKFRHNDWGHSLRDIGIKEAQGKYILHHNADNVLYTNGLQLIADTINLDLPDFEHETGHVYNKPDIIIFPILMRGLTTWSIPSGVRNVIRKPEHADKIGIILNGFPPRRGNIDCMQLVMKTELWRKEGGWYNKRIASDSTLYNKFTRKYGSRYVMEVIAEHW